MGETYEIPHHNLANFEPRLGCATKGQAVRGIPLQTLRKALIFTHNHNPCILQWEEPFLLLLKMESWIG